MAIFPALQKLTHMCMAFVYIDISNTWVEANFSVMDSIVIDGKPRIHHTAVSVKPVEQEFFFQINRFYHFTSDLQPCNQLVL